MTSYSQSGVDIHKNDELVAMIGDMTDIQTGFACSMPIPGLPSIVQCTDGVGSKAILGFKWGMYQNLGQDLVAMCVNDLICVGAQPAFFQDYIGMNSLNKDVVKVLIKSIAKSCEMSGMQLTGGEMAEMPGIYQHEVPEMVGFATGFLYDQFKVKTERITTDHIVIGIPSSGIHSNGFSLLRTIFENIKGIDARLVAEIMRPTTIYKGVLDYHYANPAHIVGIAHITGGGIAGNIQRILPKGLKFVQEYDYNSVSKLYKILQKLGDLDIDDMWSTFNMGIGMALVIHHSKLKEVVTGLNKTYSDIRIIGHIADDERIGL